LKISVSWRLNDPPKMVHRSTQRWQCGFAAKTLRYVFTIKGGKPTPLGVGWIA